jgi:hypothetical protein
VINGGDFLFSPSILKNTKDKFYYSTSIGVNRPEIIFSYEDGSIKSSSRKIDPRVTINYVEGTGNAISATSVFADNLSITNRKMRQENYNNSDFSRVSTLQDTVDGITENKGNGVTTYDVKLNNTYQFGTFDIGDYVRVRIESKYTGGRYELDQLMQVLKIQVTLEETGFENIAITIGDKKTFKKDSFVGYIKSLDNRIATKEKQ